MKLRSFRLVVLSSAMIYGLVGCNSGSNMAKGVGSQNTLSKSSLQKVKVTTASTNNSPLIMGYYTNWATYSANYKPENISSQVNEIIYAFAQVGSCAQGEENLPTEVNPTKCLVQKNDQGVVLQTGEQDWKLHTTDAWSDFYKYDSNGTNIGGLGNIAKTLALGKPVLLSIGGWTLSAPIATAIKPEHVDGFVTSITDFLTKAEADAAAKGVTNKFAGVDIDWEPNGNQWTRASASSTNVSLTTTDLENYKTFLTKLKTALGSRTLKIAMAASPLVIADVNAKVSGYWKSLSDLGITLDLMTYDYNAQSFAGTCTTTQFNSPLTADATNPCEEAKNMNITSSAEALNSAGVPYASMVIGIPAYGRAYALDYVSQVSSPYIAFNAADINAVHNIAVPTYNDVWTNREILTGRAYGANSTTENTRWTSTGSYAQAGQSVAIGLVNGVTPAWISYSSFDDAKNLMTFAKEKGMSGVMLWALDQDIQPNVDTSADDTPVTLDWAKMSVLAGLIAGTGNTPTPPTPVTNYSLEITNVSPSTGVTVTLISNGSVQAGPFDYENPGIGHTYDATTTYTSVKNIENASNLTVTYNSYKGTKTCAQTFNFDSYKHVMINADTDVCEIK
jgi:GH18 family chitinase